MGQSVFFAGIAGDVILARTTGIDKFYFNVLANAFQVTIPPQFPRIRGRRATTLLEGTIVGAAGGMRLNFVGRTPEDIDVAAIGLPAGNAGGEALVSISQAAIVLFFVGVDGRFRIGIAAVPEALDELLALFVCGELNEGSAFFLCDDVRDLVLQPRVVARPKLLGEFLLSVVTLLRSFLLVIELSCEMSYA